MYITIFEAVKFSCSSLVWNRTDLVNLVQFAFNFIDFFSNICFTGKAWRVSVPMNIIILCFLQELFDKMPLACIFFHYLQVIFFVRQIKRLSFLMNLFYGLPLSYLILIPLSHTFLKISLILFSKYQANARKDKLMDSYDLQRFLSDFRDLTSWTNGMKTLVASDELAKDVTGAEALLERHQVSKTRYITMFRSRRMFM